MWLTGASQWHTSRKKHRPKFSKAYANWKHRRMNGPVAHTRMMEMARLALLALVIILAYLAFRARSGA